MRLYLLDLGVRQVLHQSPTLSKTMFNKLFSSVVVRAFASQSKDMGLIHSSSRTKSGIQASLLDGQHLKR